MQEQEALKVARQALSDACDWMDTNVPRVPGAQIAMNGIAAALRDTAGAQVPVRPALPPVEATQARLSILMDMPDERSIAEVLWTVYCDQAGYGECDVPLSNAEPSHLVFKQAAAVTELLAEKLRLGPNQDLPPGWVRDSDGGLTPPVGAMGIAYAATGLSGGSMDEINAFKQFKSNRGEAAHYESDGLFKYSSTNDEFAAWLHRASIAQEISKLSTHQPLVTAKTPHQSAGAADFLPAIRAGVAKLMKQWDDCGAYPDTETERQALHNAMAALRKMPGIDTGLERSVSPADDAISAESSQALELADALRWRALVGSARIKPQGSAGLESPQPGNYAHMGLELWTVYDQAGKKDFSGDNSLGVRWLTTYADIAVRAGLGSRRVTGHRNPVRTPVNDEIKGDA